MRRKLCLVTLATVFFSNVVSGEGRLVGMNDPNRIENQYVVIFKDDPSIMSAYRDKADYVSNMVSAIVSETRVSVKKSYTNAINGMTVVADYEQLQKLQQNPNISYIEADKYFYINDVQPQPDSWGLDRIDQRQLPLSQSYEYTLSGKNVDVYVIDTGIRDTHVNFKGRVGVGYDAVDQDSEPQDCQGHGTHVAGTILGSEYGVAKNATVHAVRVLNCDGSGSTSDIIDGIDWVIESHSGAAVANMSLGGGASTALDNAVKKGVNSGVTFVVAAGNDNYNACSYSPAREVSAVTVGATDQWDSRASFSNYGKCVTLFAPGVDIRSSANTGDTDSRVFSGTSMASPHVAGVAALYLEENPKASPKEVKEWLVKSSTKNQVKNPGAKSENRLLYSLGGEDDTPEPPEGSCADLQAWSYGQIYAPGDEVIYDQKQYMALRWHMAATPDNPYYGSDYWAYMSTCSAS